jgi:Bacterial regulatory proteins, crp family
MPAQLHARGRSGDAIHLRMTREDIGSYLGLTKLARSGVICLELKEVRVLDLQALHQLARQLDDSDCQNHPLVAVQAKKPLTPKRKLHIA